MTYENYKKLGGIISEQEFNQLLPLVKELMLNYVASLVPHWRLKETLEEMVETDSAYTNQIDFIAMNGGNNVFYGQNDLDLKQISTGGFTYSIQAGEQLETFKGIPISPLSSGNLLRQLRSKGYLRKSL